MRASASRLRKFESRRHNRHNETTNFYGNVVNKVNKISELAFWFNFDIQIQAIT
jgi:hypothetical protein